MLLHRIGHHFGRRRYPAVVQVDEIGSDGIGLLYIIPEVFIGCQVGWSDGSNIFSNPDGTPSKEFYWYIGGLQKYIPAAMALFAPYVNSYRRLARFTAAPINIQWGTDNRTVGFRAPVATPASRRIENRIIGADANPYVALAATLACGYLGMVQQLTPSEPTRDSAWNVAHELPRHLEDAIERMRACTPMREVLGDSFVDAFCAVKELEYATYNRVISSWEREHLLLLV